MTFFESFADELAKIARLKIQVPGRRTPLEVHSLGRLFTSLGFPKSMRRVHARSLKFYRREFPESPMVAQEQRKFYAQQALKGGEKYPKQILAMKKRYRSLWQSERKIRKLWEKTHGKA